MLNPLKRQAEKPAAAPAVSFAEFDPVLTSMRRRLIELASQEENLLAQIMLAASSYRPPALGVIPPPAQYAKPKPLSATEIAARELLNGYAPPLPEAPPGKPIELFSTAGNERAIKLQRQIEAVRAAREILNAEVAKRTAQASRLFCGEQASAYAEHVKSVATVLVSLASACQRHEQFVTDLRTQGCQLAFLPIVNMTELQAVLENAAGLVERANEAGHCDVRAELAEAAKPLPLPAREDSFADVKARLAEAQVAFETVKKGIGTRRVGRPARVRSADHEQHV